MPASPAASSATTTGAASAANNFISPHGFENFHREVERKRLGVNVAFEADLGEGFTLVAEGFYAKLDEYNRAAGINISNRWDGGAFGVWTTRRVRGIPRARTAPATAVPGWRSTSTTSTPGG